MPRSSGGGKGSFSSSSSRPDVQRNAAARVALSSSSESIESYLTGDSNSCQVVFDHYEECLKHQQLYAGSCDYIRGLKESCSRFKRDPRRQSVFERLDKWEESIQREATKAGFASVDEYRRYKWSKDPGMCRIAYRMYKECVSRDPTDRVCDVHRLDCWQFRS